MAAGVVYSRAVIHDSGGCICKGDSWALIVFKSPLLLHKSFMNEKKLKIVLFYQNTVTIVQILPVLTPPLFENNQDKTWDMKKKMKHRNLLLGVIKKIHGLILPKNVL